MFLLTGAEILACFVFSSHSFSPKHKKLSRSVNLFLLYVFVILLYFGAWQPNVAQSKERVNQQLFIAPPVPKNESFIPRRHLQPRCSLSVKRQMNSQVLMCFLLMFVSNVQVWHGFHLASICLSDTCRPMGLTGN